MVTSCVKNHGGVPMLFVNDNPVNPAAYITYFTDKNMYKEFAGEGYTLYSVPTYFTEQTINEFSRLPPFQIGIFDKIYDGGKPDYSVFDGLIADILENCPKAMIFPRVNVSIPYEWEERNPDELCEFGYAEHHRASFFSDAWAEETKRLLSMFIAHIEESSYRDHIIGYQISAGNTEEWFPFDMKGCRGIRVTEKFREYCLEKYGRENGSDAEFAELVSEITADRVIDFCKTVKDCTDGRIAAGAFYGYTYEVPEADRGHFCLRKVLESPYVDFLCSPNSYYKTRVVGVEHPYMLPIDSLKKAGKLYLCENDTRTHLSTPPNDIPRYQSPVWFGPAPEITCEIMKMHFAKAFCHGNGMWWFDMWGGWYRDERYMNLLGKLRRIYAENIENNLESASEVAMFYDEKSPLLMSSEHPAYRLMYNIRERLGFMGAPYDMYLADDFDDVCDKYKALILVQSAKTSISEEIIKKAKEKGRELFVISLDRIPGSSEEKKKLCEDIYYDVVTPAQLREFCRKCGVHIYTDKKAVIYSSKSYVFMHTGEDGEYNFSFDCKTSFVDEYTGETVTFPKKLPLGKSFLFKK